MFTKEMKGIIKMFVSAIITAFTIAGIIFTFTIESKMNKAREDGYNAGYHAAIEDAELFSITEEQFTLTFNGEEHIYSSSIGKEVMDEANKNGYQKAIKDAELVSSNEYGYVLSFNGELHSYSFS